MAGADEDIAGELERSAGRAQARGGLAAAAAFLERATMLTPDPKRRTRRALASAQAKVSAGEFEAALDLLAIAEAGRPGEAEQARVMLVRAQVAFATSRDNDVPALLLAAARRLEPVDVGLARLTYFDAIRAAVFVGRFAAPGAPAWESIPSWYMVATGDHAIAPDHGAVHGGGRTRTPWRSTART